MVLVEVRYARNRGTTPEVEIVRIEGNTDSKELPRGLRLYRSIVLRDGKEAIITKNGLELGDTFWLYLTEDNRLSYWGKVR